MRSKIERLSVHQEFVFRNGAWRSNAMHLQIPAVIHQGQADSRLNLRLINKPCYMDLGCGLEIKALYVNLGSKLPNSSAVRSYRERSYREFVSLSVPSTTYCHYFALV